MASIEPAILEAAFADGLIGIHRADCPYLTRSVNNLNQILDALYEESELDIEQISMRTGLGQSTVKVLCQWAKDKGLINFEREGNRHIHKLAYHKVSKPVECKTIGLEIVSTLETIAEFPDTWDKTTKGAIVDGIRKALKLAAQLI